MILRLSKNAMANILDLWNELVKKKFATSEAVLDIQNTDLPCLGYQKLRE